MESWRTERGTVKSKELLGSVLPDYKLEYSDGTTNWYKLATENYLTQLAKQACYAATTGTALNVTYINGTSGVGATLTNAGTQAVFSIDGQTPPVGSRILVKDQSTNTFQNGIYVLTSAGSVSTNWVLTRATDYDSNYLVNPGDEIVVAYGTQNAASIWMQTAASPTAIGTTGNPINFTVLSGVTIQILGTANQITVASLGNNQIQLSIPDSPAFTGLASFTNSTAGSIAASFASNGGIVIPVGSTANRPSSAVAGTIRLNNGT